MPDTARPLAHTYSLLTAAALALQAAGGLFISGLYRNNAWVSSVLRGQDFVALVLVTPLLLVSHRRARRGSFPWRLLWLGVLYKIFYNNMYYLTGTAFNAFFLVYVAVFICSCIAIVSALLDTDPAIGTAGILPVARRKAVAAILFVEAVILAVLWAGQSLAYIVTGEVPKLVEDAGGGVHLIAAFDLTLVVPLLVLGAAWLWQARRWGYVIAAAMSVQCGLITVDLLVTPAFQAAAGVPDAWAMVPLFAAMATGFLASAFLLLRAARAVSAATGRTFRALAVLALACAATVTLSSAGAAKPIRDDVGFCWNRDAMGRFVDYLAKTADGIRAQPNIVAAIAPHDDYLYAGRVYYPLYSALRAKQVVIFGVTHSGVRKEIGDPRDVLILDDFSEWPGLGRPVGVAPLRDYLKARLDRSDFITSGKAHGLEHSIEAELPFLQHFNPEVTIVPIMVTQMPWERMDRLSERLASIFAAYIQERRLVPGTDIAFLISSDANHYGEDFNNAPFGLDAKAHAQATANDRRIAHEFLDGPVTPEKVNGLTVRLNDVIWCGKFAVPLGLLTSTRTLAKLSSKHLEGTVLRYSDTYSEGVLPVKNTGMGTTAPASYRHWCGWLSAAFYAR